MDVKLRGHNFSYDITSMAMLFFPGKRVNYINKSSAPLRASSVLKLKNGKKISVARIVCNGKTFVSVVSAPVESDSKNLVKQSFYRSCSKATGITSPWGILTGIRPLSVYSKLKNSGLDAEKAIQKEYYVSANKVQMLSEIYEMEKDVVFSDKNDVSVYISVPFCPTKCSYCSFISVAATNKYALLEDYLENLIHEIKYRSSLITKYCLNVKTLYVGGGTPGILNEQQLEKLLEVLEKHFEISKLSEVCFEMGRPETVTKEKLDILKKHCVSRICINTQTTNDIVLENVNRKHSRTDFIKAVKLAQSCGFNSINTDVIAGLPGESFDSFCKTLEDVINTGVDNITVHTLAIKKSSALGDNLKNYSPVEKTVSAMLEYASERMHRGGFSPYYIYRQKNCVSNGENIGYCKNGKICLYNVYMMEDVHSVIAFGAGASTKIINGSKVERVINVKYPMEYVNEFDKILRNTDKTEEILKAVLLND